MSSQDSQTWFRSFVPDRADPYVRYVGRVWRYKRGGQNPYIKKGQTNIYKMTNNDQHNSSLKSKPFSNWCMSIWNGSNE